MCYSALIILAHKNRRFNTLPGLVGTTHSPALRPALAREQELLSLVDRRGPFGQIPPSLPRLDVEVVGAARGSSCLLPLVLALRTG